MFILPAFNLYVIVIPIYPKSISHTSIYLISSLSSYPLFIHPRSVRIVLLYPIPIFNTFGPVSLLPSQSLFVFGIHSHFHLIPITYNPNQIEAPTEYKTHK